MCSDVFFTKRDSSNEVKIMGKIHFLDTREAQLPEPPPPLATWAEIRDWVATRILIFMPKIPKLSFFLSDAPSAHVLQEDKRFALPPVRLLGAF